jgi:hypothetical protein
MTAYRDYVVDFPSRCLEVMEMATRTAKLRQREVTLTIMVASAGLVVPYERLSAKKAHPSGDAATFSDTSKNLNQLMQSNFLESPLARKDGSWCGGKLRSISGDPDSWPELQNAKPFGADKTVGGVIRIIRNALAHGNIFTCGDPIREIVFVCERTDSQGNVQGFSFALVSPEDFQFFLIEWFTFLKNGQISMVAVHEVVAHAA